MPLDSKEDESKILEAIERVRTGAGEVDEIVRAMLEAELIRQATTDIDPPGYDRARVRSIIEAELNRMNALASVAGEKIEKVKEVVVEAQGLEATVADEGAEPQVSVALMQEINQAVEKGLEEVTEPDPVDIKEREHAGKMLATMGKKILRTILPIDYKALRDLLPEPYMELTNCYGYLDKSWETQLLEMSVKRVMGLNGRGNYNAVLEKLLEGYVLIETDRHWRDEYRHWSHSLCHLYENYGRGDSGRSLLKEPGLKEANTRAINEAGRRMVEVGDLGCMPRIVIPLLRWNLDQIDPGNLDAPIALKPEGLEDADYVKYLESLEEDNETKKMLVLSRAKTVRELLVGMVRQDVKDDRQGLCYSISTNMARLLRILEGLRPEITIEELNNYMSRAVYNQMGRDTGIAKIGYEALKDNVETAEKATEMCPGLYVDVDGTLLLHEKGKGLQLNEAVLNAMKEAGEMGVSVTIVTGGDPELKAKQLLGVGLSETYLPVKSKYDYRGKALELLLDDTAPEIQGLKAGSYHNACVYGFYTLRLVKEGEKIIVKPELKKKQEVR